MIEPKKIRKGDVVATKHQSIIVERIEGEGENLAFLWKDLQQIRMPKWKDKHPPTHLRLRDLQSYTRSESHNETKRLRK